jgi:hypothetical protein
MLTYFIQTGIDASTRMTSLFNILASILADSKLLTAGLLSAYLNRIKGNEEI